MPLSSTLGAASSRGLGFNSAAGEPAFFATITSSTTTNSLTSQSHAIDSLSNIYMPMTSAQSTGANGVLTKIDKNGTFQWWVKVNSSGGPTNGNYDRMDGPITVDSNGDVIVVAGDGSNGRPIVIKYNSSGVIQWQRLLYNPNFGTQYDGIRCDSSNNIYLTGYTGVNQSVTDYAILAIKLNSSGVIQWQTVVNQTQGNDIPQTAVALSSSGNLYIAGYSNTTTPEYRAFIVKLEPSAGSISYQKFVTGDVTYFAGLAVDSSENLYAAGGKILAKFNSSGTLQWSRKMTSNFAYYSCAIDSDGNIIAVGEAASYEGIIAKYDSSGTLLLQRKTASTFFSMKYPVEVITDGKNYTLALQNQATSPQYYSTLFAKLPIDGTKTGSYTVSPTSRNLSYSTTTETETAGSLTVNNGNLSQSAPPSTYTSTASSLIAGTPTDLTYTKTTL